MNRTITYIMLAGLLFAGNRAIAQTTGYEKLTEPYIERPFTQHRGILSITGNYSHLLGNNYFDSEGTRLAYNEVVRSTIEDDFDLLLQYGILEFLEATAGIMYRNRYESFPTYFVSNSASSGSENTVYRYAGFSNLDAGLKARTPVIGAGFELYLSGGLLLPFPKQEPDQPAHSVFLYDPPDPGGSYELNYLFNPAPGLPGTSCYAGFGARFRNNNFGISLEGRYRSPLSEVNTFSWDYRLYGTTFAYSASPYTIRPKGSLRGVLIAEVQPYPWFAIFGGYYLEAETPGWSDKTGQAVSLTKSSMGNVHLGFEVQVSTHFRLLQKLYIPVHGRNAYTEFEVTTGLVWSLYPIKNNVQ